MVWILNVLQRRIWLRLMVLLEMEDSLKGRVWWVEIRSLGEVTLEGILGPQSLLFLFPGQSEVSSLFCYTVLAWWILLPRAKSNWSNWPWIETSKTMYWSKLFFLLSWFFSGIIYGNGNLTTIYIKRRSENLCRLLCTLEEITWATWLSNVQCLSIIH